MPARQVIDLSTIFPKKAPIVLEIGFGTGATLLAMAKQYPEFNFLGIEVYKTGIAKLFIELDKTPVANLRVIHGDAVKILTQHILSSSLQIVQLFFPDPWPKARHHKRRIIQTDFIKLIAKCLVINGILHIATDWADYARHIIEIFADSDNFLRLNSLEANNLVLNRTTTKFENRGLKLGFIVFTNLFFNELNKSNFVAMLLNALFC